MTQRRKKLERKDEEGNIVKIVSIEEQIQEKKNKSELAAHAWKLKEKKQNFKIEWKIEKKSNAYKNGSRYCNLCANEKTCIALGDPLIILNSRNEIFHKCRTKGKFTLENFLNKKKKKTKPP